MKSCERPSVLALPFEKGNGSRRSFIVAGVWLVGNVAVQAPSNGIDYCVLSLLRAYTTKRAYTKSVRLFIF